MITVNYNLFKEAIKKCNYFTTKTEDFNKIKVCIGDKKIQFTVIYKGVAIIDIQIPAETDDTIYSDYFIKPVEFTNNAAAKIVNITIQDRSMDLAIGDNVYQIPRIEHIEHEKIYNIDKFIPNCTPNKYEFGVDNKLLNKVTKAIPGIAEYKYFGPLNPILINSRGEIIETRILLSPCSIS